MELQYWARCQHNICLFAADCEVIVRYRVWLQEMGHGAAHLLYVRVDYELTVYLDNRSWLL